jgi:hypothetical protein
MTGICTGSNLPDTSSQDFLGIAGIRPLDGNAIEQVLDPCPRRYTWDLSQSFTLAIGDIRVKVIGNQEPIYKGLTTTTKEGSVIDDIENRIFKKLNFPSYWESEGVGKPNLRAKQNAFAICKEIFSKYDLQPDKILASREDGVFISYDSSTDIAERSMIIETYNNCETAVVISDNRNKEILYSEDIYGIEFKNAVRAFKETSC